MTAPMRVDRVARSGRVGSPLPVQSSWTRTLSLKVPAATPPFWVVTALCPTVGETAGIVLAHRLGLGLSAATAITAELFVIVLIWQLCLPRYVPGVYWLTVLLAAAVGALCSESLIDGLDLRPGVSTTILAAALAASLTGWRCCEPTLSMDSIRTRRREGWFWLTVVCAFSLGTSIGSLVAAALDQARPSVRPSTQVLIFCGVVVLVAILGRTSSVNAVVVFWTAYVVTTPLGASIGHLLAAEHRHGGLGVGTIGTDAVFLVLVLVTVGWLTRQQPVPHPS